MGWTTETWKTQGSDFAISEMRENKMLDGLIANKLKAAMLPSEVSEFINKVYSELTPHVKNFNPKVNDNLSGWIGLHISKKRPGVIDKAKKDFLPNCLFQQLSTKVLCNIDNIRAQECSLYSDKYKLAGRVDCIAEYNGILSVIDFKTASRERNDEYNQNYYIQASAYAEMFEERTAQSIDQIVILVVTEDGVVQEFIKDKKSFIPMIEEITTEFNKEVSHETITNNT